MKKAVVFGGSGFLGSYVADELSSRGFAVVIADVKESSYLAKGQAFQRCDVMDPGAVAKAVQGAVVVYNFAGLADLDESINMPKETMEQNVIGNINVLEACRAGKLDRFIYASSAYAFSNKGSFYGISKLASEKIVEEYSKRFGVKFTIIRYGSLYGERADSHNGMYRLLREAIETRAIRHRGDGEEVREYTHAADAAKLSVDIVEDAQFVNQHTILTGFERLRKRDLFRMVQEILNDEVTISFSDEPWEGHYEVTPYSYHPNVARKLVSNSFIDLGQGLVSCIQKIHDEIEAEKES
jgi:UDP-glucose 4-epimerase